MYRGERFNSITHLVGAALALVALVVLVVAGAVQGDAWKIVSFSIYGSVLLLMYVFSTLYHSIPHAGAKRVLQKFDHIAIYLLIAATYTPFALVTLRGPWGWTLFGINWGLAVFGIIQDLLFPTRGRWLSLVIYVVMGWLIVIAMGPLMAALPAAGLYWLAGGGALYTIGVIFFILDERWPPAHGIWHLFVLGGSAAQYWCILRYVAPA